MISLHDDINERLELRVTDNLVRELRPELAAFLKHLGIAHLLEEVFVPLEATTRTKRRWLMRSVLGRRRVLAPGPYGLWGW